MPCSERPPAARALPYAALLLALLAAACSPSQEPTAAPTPVPVVHVSPAAAPFVQALGRAYVQQQGPLPFDLIPFSGGAARKTVEAGEAALLIDLPPAPDGWFATPLGQDGVTLIVNESVTTRNLTFDELRLIFTGRASQWSELAGGSSAVEVVVPPPGDPLRGRFERTVLQGARVTTRARLAPDPASAVELVAATPGAVALVPFSAGLSAGVRRVRVQGVAPSPNSLADGDYPLTYPVLAMAPQEPTGAVRDWLLWVQGQGDRVSGGLAGGSAEKRVARALTADRGFRTMTREQAGLIW